MADQRLPEAKGTGKLDGGLDWGVAGELWEGRVENLLYLIYSTRTN